MTAMRLDHMLLAVRDLDTATFDFRQRLGMNVVVGGVHPGRGTHNSLVHFGSAYLELIAVNDPSQERAQAFVRHLEGGDAPYTFAIAVADLEAASKELVRRGLRVDQIKDGSRKTPEGVLLKWRAAQVLPGPGGPGPESPPLPFMIQWVGDQAGTGWFRDRVVQGRHPVPWASAHALIVATRDPIGLAREYTRLFGWEVGGSGDPIHLVMPGGSGVNLALGHSPAIVLVSGMPRAPMDQANILVAKAAQRRLERHGAGVIGLAIKTPNIHEAVDALSRRGARVHEATGGRWAAVDPADAHGMLIELIA
jgi:catechol 2,3-dioxygenase-like lactoylglutathione lyase family enzyme